MRIAVIILLLITGLNALATGYGFMADPTGQVLGMTTEYLQFSPFETFLIPGIILFCVMGVFSTVAAIMAIKQKKCYPVLTIVEGCFLTGWIVIQIMMVRDFNWLHGTFLGVGLILILFGKKLRDKRGLTKESG